MWPRSLNHACGRDRAERIDAEANIGGFWPDAASLDERSDKAWRILPLRAQFQFDRDPSIEMYAVECPAQRRLGRRDAEAVRAGRAGKDQREAGGTVFQFMEGFRVGRSGIGQFDPLHDLPRTVGRARDERTRVPRGGVERLDAQAVIRPADEPVFVADALERRRHQPQPILPRRRREFGGKR